MLFSRLTYLYVSGIIFFYFFAANSCIGKIVFKSEFPKAKDTLRCLFFFFSPPILNLNDIVLVSETWLAGSRALSHVLGWFPCRPVVAGSHICWLACHQWHKPPFHKLTLGFWVLLSHLQPVTCSKHQLWRNYLWLDLLCWRCLVQWNPGPKELPGRTCWDLFWDSGAAPEVLAVLLCQACPVLAASWKACPSATPKAALGSAVPIGAFWPVVLGDCQVTPSRLMFFLLLEYLLAV